MRIDCCRSCRSETLIPVLSLGLSPLANALLTEDQLHQPEHLYPLELVFCPMCSLVQINETVPPEDLFRNYLYYSSVSDTVLSNARDIVERTIVKRRLDSTSTAVEIASNDGYLLKVYQEYGVPILGIEPARNIAEEANNHGTFTIPEFFNLRLAQHLRKDGWLADVVHANNVIAHVADLSGMVKGIYTLLKDKGVAIIETPYVKDLVDYTEFDTIYHEHLCYYSLKSISTLLEQHGLKVIDVERIPIHGGSLRIFAARKNSKEEVSARVGTLLLEEASWGVDQADFYICFGEKVEQLRRELVGCIKELKEQGKRIAVYGASAKGTTLLNFFHIGSDELDYVVDRSPVKQGRFTPGMHLPIFAPEILVEDKPDYVLLLTWNFVDEILAQQTEYRALGGKFIVPIPEVKIL